MKGDKTLAELAQLFDVRPNQVTQWRSQMLEGAAGLFGADRGETKAAPRVDLKALHAKIGELTLEKIPKKRQHRLSAPRAGEQSRMTWHADANC